MSKQKARSGSRSGVPSAGDPSGAPQPGRTSRPAPERVMTVCDRCGKRAAMSLELYDKMMETLGASLHCTCQRGQLSIEGPA